ncbi:hypothetical protein [Chitinimonas sp. BJB300]|uniref:hypothetical protein n=1 Tax=Chitinimonas sp. BJB300 TaxID=1559339 RepID=UPI000C103AFA|nr:hypothetical protein [Chitinimonas sp. BJB300]PHV10386.1 hypothetical protein CSQ89_16450 [Chitinimonas sp. BJB300]TSJ87526.1 hypothetical protein FG002_013400 [Chitinimonas sp. BJB300]
MSNTRRVYRPLAQVRAVGGVYVDQVVADFRALPPESEQKPRYAEAKQLADNCEDLDWQQLFALELWVLQLMPLYQLEERAAVLGQIFTNPASLRPAVGVEDYQERLCCWALNMQSERQWVFRKNLLREQEAWRLRKRLGETLLWVGVLALSLAWFGWLIELPAIPILAMVTWLGISGGYASIARRSQAASATRPGEASSGTAFGNLCALDVGQGSVVQAMLLAGLFAVVAYGLLASGLLGQLLQEGVTNTLFPQFSPLNELGLPLPKAGNDVAKLSVWSFLAGFAERLVPDVLDKLSGKSKNKEEKQNSG